jgi:hypothetical protein
MYGELGNKLVFSSITGARRTLSLTSQGPKREANAKPCPPAALPDGSGQSCDSRGQRPGEGRQTHSRALRRTIQSVIRPTDGLRLTRQPSLDQTEQTMFIGLPPGTSR